MTEADFNQIRLIVTEAVSASEKRMTGAIEEAVSGSEKRMTGAIEEAVSGSEKRMTGAIEEAVSASEKRMTGAIDASEKRQSQALTRVAIELDRRINDLEKRIVEGQETAIQRAVEQLTELVRETETNLLTSFHGYAKGQTARLHAMEVTQSDVNIRLAAIEERILNLETRRPIVPPAA